MYPTYESAMISVWSIDVTWTMIGSVVVSVNEVNFAKSAGPSAAMTFNS